MKTFNSLRKHEVPEDSEDNAETGRSTIQNILITDTKLK